MAGIFNKMSAFGKGSAKMFGKATQSLGKMKNHTQGVMEKSVTFKNMRNNTANSASMIKDFSGALYGKSTLQRIQKRGIFSKAISSSASLTTQFIVGSVGMASLAIMNGGMQQSHDIMMQRYMRDQRYSGRLLNQTSIGAAKRNSPLNMGNHVGLSLSLHKIRHSH